MVFWFIVGYVAFIAVLIAYSAHVAISCPDVQQRADAYKVLRLIWATGTGAGGLTLVIFNVVIKLQEVGAI
ncbi:hypothetical protein DFR70_13015 [Nocardia tenerifensis]|uniref:Uncharacterized protein n=1 Tax=Nocardia tenerifensis TaxID=228006 RepID=A0A318K0H5_9NOCA|nr:hypothetical protein [Nocardia tenerifensis]PXX52767.1 hypothetical protein DFR70_13015 [Nocardia tenerifensis]